MSIWEKILYKGQSKFNGEVRVTENAGSRRLVADGYTQSQNLSKNPLISHVYWESMIPENLSLKSDSRVLILGLAAGTTAKIIRNRFGMVPIDGVEIDPLIIELGKKFFSLEQPKLNIIVGDAKKFVKNARHKYDLICIDAFIGKEFPRDMETTEFFGKIKKLLKKKGKVTINKIFSGEEELEELTRITQSVFPSIDVKIIGSGSSQKNVIVTTGV